MGDFLQYFGLIGRLPEILLTAAFHEEFPSLPQVLQWYGGSKLG
jgi:hypothetical protein